MECTVLNKIMSCDLPGAAKELRNSSNIKI